MTELLWGDRPAPRRGPKPALTPEQIAQAAIAIADAEGLAAVSMQRVTADLGFTKMAIYRYVPGKAELVALMTELASGDPPTLPGGTWRTKLKRWAALLLERFERHPWLLEATVGPRPVGPRELGWLEAALRTLERTNLAGGEKLDVVVTITGHVRMLAQQGRNAEAEMLGAIAPLIADRRDEFPALLKAMGGPHDRAFDVGLECILDGIQRRSARKPGGKPAGGADS